VTDLGQCLCRRAAVGRRTVDAGDELVLQGGDAHLEELVEVGGGDRAELGPFEQRDAGLARQLQDAVVELDPAQLPIVEPLVGHGAVSFPDRSARHRAQAQALSSA
jgi:hypothetical protein